MTKRILSDQISLQKIVWFEFYCTIYVAFCLTVLKNAKPSLEISEVFVRLSSRDFIFFKAKLLFSPLEYLVES